MKRLRPLALFAAIALLPCSQSAHAGRAEYEAMVAAHARANAVPAVLVHRVIVRESRYQPTLIGHGGTIGLMQIKLATARGLGYSGDAEGLRDPNTNLTYGVKYLAGAYRAANGDHDRAMHFYASGYYEAAKQWRHQRVAVSGVESSGNPVPAPREAEIRRQRPRRHRRTGGSGTLETASRSWIARSSEGMTRDSPLTRPPIGLHYRRSEGSSDEELRDRTLKSIRGCETAVTL